MCRFDAMSGGYWTQAASIQPNWLHLCRETLHRFSVPAFLLVLLDGQSIPRVKLKILVAGPGEVEYGNNIYYRTFFLMLLQSVPTEIQQVSISFDHW